MGMRTAPDKDKERKIPKIAINRATGRGILPEAIGRFFLRGWRRSLGKSIISLIKYKEEVAMEKMTTAQTIVPKFLPTKRFPEKIRGAKRLKFLSVCRGRIDLNKLKRN